MKRIVAIVICLAFLASGLARIGVSTLMIGQAEGWWNFGGEASEALADTIRFIGEREINLVGFSPVSYFGFIAFMGLTISLGAIGALLRRRWGMALIFTYILSHAFLFVNFWTVNPKLAYLAAAAIGAALVAWAQRADAVS
ncbi:hypothetical protein [Parerythrobacter aestuarii]|uniref:hypothetical protein n=1 Tax=Parerythrobacter aestuarii TaxID=3020909 RepID=UPI0024DDFCD6|nr:hypothetical protein [Parerythrobacter aestuarii]